MMHLDQWCAQAQYFDANGHKIAYWTSAAATQEGPTNNKPWLLLIHGYPTSSWDWTAMWPELEEKFNLIALDMLGFGLSDKPKSFDYAINRQADLQEALLAQLAISEAHLFVHDYGNTVGQELLARHNEGTLSFAIKSMCFLNGGLFPEQHRPRPIQRLGLTPLGFLLGALMTRDKFRNTFDQIFGPQTKASDLEIDGHWSLIRQHDGQKVLHKLLHYIPERKHNRQRWVGALHEARAPIRLIDGGADPVSGRHLYDYYRQEIASADAVLLDDIGHYPHTEAPDRVLNAFFDFHANIGTDLS